MAELIEMGTMSSRGQISIPNDIRKEMGLEEGTKVVFLLTDDALMVKKATMESFASITKPLKDVKKKIDEHEVTALIHRIRARRK
ncbi:MAG: AbrB/MazE/SpoVT family DNA-binding domain-containing protein [Nanoarchaeota archaeon]